MARPAEHRATPPDRASAGPAPAERRARAGPELCRTDAPAECPACASPMRLWAAYYRCRNCGYKESCCF
jgi:hypothetical protein